MSIAEKCLEFSGLFEAELLLELMLRYWHHPLADDKEFRNDVLERAAEALRAAIGGETLIESVPAHELNFVAAVWYVEWASVSAGAEDPGGKRQEWLESVRGAVPSCFCAQEDLP
jgi:hypothetical protein